MKIVPTPLPEVLLIRPDVHRDERGFFLESFHARRFAEAGLPSEFVQDNHSRSEAGVLRGLHAQLERPQGKLVRVTRGEVYDVAVDIRRGSPRFGQHVGVRLDAETAAQLWIPEGFAHGFCVLGDDAEIQYKCTALYDPASEVTIAWNDAALAIDWPIETPRLSRKDRAGRALSTIDPGRLPAYSG